MKKCEQCGSDFEPTQPHNPNRFCSKRCLWDSQRKPAVMVKLRCERCGNEFERAEKATQGWGRKGRFCGNRCAGAAAGESRKPTRQYDALRECAVCGTEFRIGGRGNPDKDVRFCSTDCRTNGRYRHGSHINELSPADAAYLAGFWDGEGTIMLAWRNERVRLTVSIVNTDKGVMEWIAQVTGLSTPHRRQRANPNHRETWMWAIHSDAADSLLKQLRPYLKVKAVQADLAIETQERMRTPRLKANPSWHAEYRDRMSALNHSRSRSHNIVHEPLAVGNFSAESEALT